MIRTIAAAATRAIAPRTRSVATNAARRATHTSAATRPATRHRSAWALLAGGAVIASTLALTAHSNDEKAAACAAGASTSAASVDPSASASAPVITAPPVLGHSVFAFGSNSFGCLGLGLDDRAGGRPVPTLIPALAGRPLTQIVAAGNACAALDEQGQLWTWGSSSRGVLGHPGSGNSGDNQTAATTAAGAAAGAVVTQPALVSALIGRRLIHVALSETHGAAVELLADGSTQVLSWGTKALGFPAPPPSADRPGGSKVATSRGARDIRDTSFNTITSPSVALLPQVVPALAGKHIVAVACGLKHTLALSATGEVFSCGSDREGALGLGDTLPRVEPELISALRGVRIVAVGAGNGSSLFVDSDGRVYSAGSNEKGQAGTGSAQRRYLTPQAIPGLSQIKQVAVGALHALAVDTQGRAYSWGWNAEGQGGLGDRSLEHRFPLQINLGQTNSSSSTQRQSASAASSSPSASSASPAPSVTHVSAGFGHSVVVTSDGALWACGRGREGQLGRGDQLESVAAGRESPVRSKFFEERGYQVVAAAAGADFTLALIKEDATKQQTR